MRDVFRRKEVRMKIKSTVKKSKNKWIENHCKTLNQHYGIKSTWDSLKLLKTGLSKTKPSSKRKMKKPDGTLCTSAEENASVFRDHFQQLYDRSSSFDPTVLDSLPQLPVFEGYDFLPSDDEISKATTKLKNSALGESGISSYEWKCLLNNEATYLQLRSMIHHMWNTETIPDEWIEVSYS